MMRPDAETAAAAAASKMTIWGGLATAGWGFIQSNWIGFIGVVVTVLTLIVNSYYKRKAERRHAEHHQARMHERELRGLILEQIRKRNERLYERGDFSQMSDPGFADTGTAPAALGDDDGE